MFKKLSELQVSWEHVSVEHCRGEFIQAYGAGSWYMLLNAEQLFGVALDVLQPDRKRWVEINAGDLSPHRDHDSLTSINVYIEPADAVTTFWKIKEGAVPFTAVGARSANLYHPWDIQPISRFVAKKHDVYLLNQQHVHSVKMKPGTVRQFIQLSWNSCSFDEVLQRLASIAQ